MTMTMTIITWDSTWEHWRIHETIRHMGYLKVNMPYVDKQVTVNI